MFMIPYYTSLCIYFFLFKHGYSLNYFVALYLHLKKKDLKEKTINTNENKDRPIRSENKNTCTCCMFWFEYYITKFNCFIMFIHVYIHIEYY